MSDSIVYDHNIIIKDNLGCFSLGYHLVKYNGHVLRIYASSSMQSQKQNIICIKNLSTQFEFNFNVGPTNKTTLLSYTIETPFMYLENILLIEADTITQIDEEPGPYYQHVIYFVNLQNQEVKTVISNIKGGGLRPIGQKYVQTGVYWDDGKSRIYKWNDLEKLDKDLKPVYICAKDTYIYSIDWSSSSIGALANCTGIKTSVNSEFIELLDSNLNFIMKLNVKEMFPNYKPIEYNDEDTNQADPICIIFGVNNNILLFVECFYSQILDRNVSGFANCYCWDFTSNTQVHFPTIKLTSLFNKVIPFRDYTTGTMGIKYIALEEFNRSYWYKIYESD